MTLCALSTSLDAASNLSAILTKQARAFLHRTGREKFGATPPPLGGALPQGMQLFLRPVSHECLSSTPKCFYIIVTLCAFSTSLDATSNLLAVLTIQARAFLHWSEEVWSPPPRANQNIFILYVEVATLVGGETTTIACTIVHRLMLFLPPLTTHLLDQTWNELQSRYVFLYKLRSDT
jgi:hypothetical protein